MQSPLSNIRLKPCSNLYPHLAAILAEPTAVERNCSHFHCTNIELWLAQNETHWIQNSKFVFLFRHCGNVDDVCIHANTRTGYGAVASHYNFVSFPFRYFGFGSVIDSVICMESQSFFVVQLFLLIFVFMFMGNIQRTIL